MRTKKALMNIATKFLYQIVALITGLITPRLILSAYGSSYNGAISSISQFLSMTSILTIGIAGATRVELYKTLSAKDVDGTSRIIIATEKTFKKVGYVLVLYTILLSIIFPTVLKTQLPSVDIILLVFILSISTFGQYYFGQTYYLLLQADQREYITTFVHIVVTILNTIISVILIKVDASILVVKLGGSVLCLLYPWCIYEYARKKYKIKTNIDADVSLLKQRKAAMFHSVANIVHDNTDILLLTLFTDVFAVSVYTVYYMVVKNIKQIMQNFTAGLEAAFGSMWAKGEMDLFRRNFNTYEFLSFSFSSVVFNCTGLLLIPFIKIYTFGIKDVNYVLPMFAFLVTFAEGVFCVRQPYITIVQAAGKYKETKNGALVEAAINFGLSLVLVNIWGIEGVVLGTLIANVFRTCQYAFYSSKDILDRNILAFLYKVLWHILNTCIIVFIYKLIVKNIIVDSWSQWILVAVVAFIISSIVTIFSAFLFYRKELHESWFFLVRMVKKNIK